MYYLLILILSISLSFSATDMLDEDFYEGFSQKITRFSHVLEASTQLNPSQPPYIAKNSAVQDIVYSVPQRGVCITRRTSNETTRLETTGIEDGVAIGVWNEHIVALVHWSSEIDVDSLERFFLGVTDYGKLNSSTSFVITTNYLGEKLNAIYELLSKHASKSNIFLEATHMKSQTFVIEEDNYRCFTFSKEDKKFRDPFYDNQSGWGKSLSIRSSFRETEVPYSFVASPLTERMHIYFRHLHWAQWGPIYSESGDLIYLNPRKFKNPQDFWKGWLPDFPESDHQNWERIAQGLYEEFTRAPDIEVPGMPIPNVTPRLIWFPTIPPSSKTIFCTEEEFSGKLKPFAEILRRSPQVTLASRNDGEREIVPIPGRGALVESIKTNPQLRLETGRIYGCLGVAAWSREKVGLCH